jgi:predicted dehydrogenase
MLRVGVVGIGFGQAVHVPAFRGDPRCRVVAVCASDKARAEAVAAKLGVERAFGDWRALAADPGIDAVAVAVPAPVQAAVVLAAAAAGKHVFCEKPAAPDVASAEALLSAVRSAGVAHAIDFEFPEIPAWARARELLSAGAIGRPRHALLNWMVETYAVRTKADNWKTRAAEGGGTLNLFVSHAFHNLEWLLGPADAVTSVDCSLWPAGSADEGGDVRVSARLAFASGLRADLTAAADAPLGSGHRLEIYGDRGALVLENPTRDYARGFRLSVGTREDGTLRPADAGDFPADADGRIAAVVPLVRRFIDAALGGPPVSPNLEHGLRVQRLLDAARESARKGRAVEVG